MPVQPVEEQEGMSQIRHGHNPVRKGGQDLRHHFAVFGQELAELNLPLGVSHVALYDVLQSQTNKF